MERNVIFDCYSDSTAVTHQSVLYSGSLFHFSGLKLLLEPILQGVLETKFEYMMDFDEYFRQVKVISQRRVSVSLCPYWEVCC